MPAELIACHPVGEHLPHPSVTRVCVECRQPVYVRPFLFTRDSLRTYLECVCWPCLGRGMETRNLRSE